jgi:hypothetical protein
MKELNCNNFRFLSAIILSAAILSIFVMAASYTQEVPIQECWAEDAAVSPGTWGSSCGNTYPGTALFSDDDVYENHTVVKGTQYYWAGLRTNSTNTSVNDCGSITEVWFCYKWWSETDHIENCDISVDANEGHTYTTIATACPGTTEPGSVTCVDVTSLEPWSCSDFFESGAFAKSEAVHDGNGAPGDFNITWDVFYFNLTYSNETGPMALANVTPHKGLTFNISDAIEIGANVTSENPIDSVYADITYPNSSTYRIYLSNTSEWYNASFAIPEMIGSYYVSLVANDTLGNVTTGDTYFLANDPVGPTITSAFISKTLLYTAQKNKLSMEASDNIAVDSCWLEITLPDTSVDNVSVLCSGVEFHYENTTPLGIYNVSFLVNDTSGNVNSTNGSFEVLPKVDFEYTIVLVNTTETINLTVTNPEDDTVVYENTTYINETIELPEAVLDFEFRAFDNRFKTKLESINVTAENNKSFGMDRYFEEDDSLVTYGINSTYNFTNATVQIYYDDLDYGSAANLRLYKCDDYNFTGRACLGSWHDISTTATRNLSEECFEFTTTSFSGFSIREYTLPQVPAPSGYLGGGPSLYYWNCSEWGECIDGEQSRECARYDMKGENVSDIQVVKRQCTVHKPRKVFDVTLIVDELLNGNSGMLNAVVFLENFGANAIFIDLNFTILNEKTGEIFHETSSVLVKDILLKEYSSLERLPDGNYTVILKAAYNSTEQEFVKYIELGAGAGPGQISGYAYLNWVNVTGGITVMVISLSYFYFSRSGYKRKFRTR